ncbi:hypothetical protein QVD17_30085 [Tagetes erecta]|uniref:Uncharacterized protein n=1 Tax=Tagetes erecta TaxID=13708 RepID=A0AAD8K4T7_TARER|nr:hypothetical protein QVD17_30085 [Tagetes erecta]
MKRLEDAYEEKKAESKEKEGRYYVVGNKDSDPVSNSNNKTLISNTNISFSLLLPISSSHTSILKSSSSSFPLIKDLRFFFTDVDFFFHKRLCLCS